MEKKDAEILNIATFLDPRFKTDFVEGVDLETVHDNIIDQGMEIFSSYLVVMVCQMLQLVHKLVLMAPKEVKSHP